MKYSEAKQGRIFVIRLEDGDIVHETLEKFASEKGIRAAAVIVLGGADQASVLVVGPEKGRAEKITPMTVMLDNVHEVAGTGTIFPNETGNPILHMHMACGRNGLTTTGCVRKGVRVWHVMEAVMFELLESDGVRVFDSSTGFELLDPNAGGTGRD